MARTEDVRRLSKQAHEILLEARRESPEAIPQAAEKALEIYENAYAIANKIGRDHLLEDLAKAAFDANQIEKAREYAKVMLRITHRGTASATASITATSSWVESLCARATSKRPKIA